MPRTLIALAVILAVFAIVCCLLPQPTASNCHSDEVPCITALHPPRH